MRVIGKDSLIKDEKTGGVVNTNKSEYQSFRHMKQRIKDMQNAQDNIQKRLDTLELICKQLVENGDRTDAI